MDQPTTASAKAVASTSAEDVRDAFTRKYHELFPAIYGYVRFRVGDPHLAEDITAHVFERALSRLVSLREPANIRAWIFAITRNAVSDHRRGHRQAADLAVVEETEHLWVSSPEDGVAQRDEVRWLLASLSEREREIIGLKFAAGLTNRDIARILKLSEANVAQVVHRTVAKLRQRLGEEESL